MESFLDLHDIQGNIMTHYAEFGYIKSRYFFLKITRGSDGRRFVTDLVKYITNSAPWTHDNAVDWPEATTNVSFTYNGLKRLGISVQTLQSFPDEFIVGMRGRRSILGDIGLSDPNNWDPIWYKDVHIFVSVDARDQEHLEKRYNEIIALIENLDGLELLDGHRSAIKGQALKYQDVSVLYENGIPTAKEHFGFTDGINNPFFKGMTEEMGHLTGGGKKSGAKNLGYGDPELKSTWEPLETGEFILGHKDEAQEYPIAPTPPLMGRNGSFLVYRKLHENVGKFNEYLHREGQDFPGGIEAMAAKFVGRWRNGAPVTTFPKEEDANRISAERQHASLEVAQAQTQEEKVKAKTHYNEINKKFLGFDFDNDLDGGKCPVGAHIRRVNPRGSLEFGRKNAFDTPTALDNRRRIIRRGLPYGKAESTTSNDGEHGTVFMCIVASIKRQFEFVLQQWVNYGNDFKLANDKDPLLGNHSAEPDGGRLIVQGSSEKNTSPCFLSRIPQFIETRGGEYFFIPSLTALRMIGDGQVDPT